MLDSIQKDFQSLAPKADFCSLRYVEEISEQLSVQQNVAAPPQTCIDRGVMVSVIKSGGLGYAATSDLSRQGLKEALDRAERWATLTGGRSVVDYSSLAMPRPQGSYRSPVADEAARLSKREKVEMLREESAQSKIDDRIVDWSASLWTTRTHQRYLTADGASVDQEFYYLVPSLQVSAFADGDTQSRSFGGRSNGFCQQGGLEVMLRSQFAGSGRQTAEEALQLLAAPNCPGGVMEVLLMPDQMMLQIHESIGHPLELDRILGDERNFAGTSFVTFDMFGNYQYGSRLLNVTYDPTRQEEFAAYAFDDDGSKAEREFLIRDGLLLKPLGGAVSQARAARLGKNHGGVANARACSWNRPPIDRMANLNVEPGASTLGEMIVSIEDGVLMKTNVSWSIDDSRNKFQFGCEWGQRIRNGKLAEVVRNPNYRGISATFWRSLSMIGDFSTMEVLGTPYCGKGEPNQVIRCGHASPACKFSGIDVFGGEN